MYNRYNAKISVNPQRTEPQYRGRNITSVLKNQISLDELIDMEESGFITKKVSIGLRLWLANHVTHLIYDERPREATRWLLQTVGDFVEGIIQEQQILSDIETYANALSPAEKNSYLFYWVDRYERIQSLAINYCLTLVDRDFYYSINQLLDTLKDYWESNGAALSWYNAKQNLANTIRFKLLEYYNAHINREPFFWR